MAQLVAHHVAAVHVQAGFLAADLDHRRPAVTVIETRVQVLHAVMLGADLTGGAAADGEAFFELELLAFEGGVQDFELQHVGVGF